MRLRVIYYNHKRDKGEIKMKFRVVHPKYFPTYFKTKRAAMLFQEQMGGEIQRKIGGSWFGY